MSKVECKYRRSMRIGDREWEWCFLFNAKTEDLNCEKCRHKTPKGEESWIQWEPYRRGVTI